MNHSYISKEKYPSLLAGDGKWNAGAKAMAEAIKNVVVYNSLSFRQTKEAVALALELVETTLPLSREPEVENQ